MQKLLGLGSYETAWTWLHKLRRAMVIPGRDLLSGDVEVDETYVGGEEPGLRGERAKGKKVLVAIAIECRGTGSGRVRMGRIADVSSESLHAFIKAHIEPGAVLLTDAWPGYSGIDQAGYRHTPYQSEPRARAARHAPGRRATRAARHYYLDEFTFRFNRRDSRARGLLFYRLLHQAVRTPPHPYARIASSPEGQLKLRATGSKPHPKV